MIIVLLVVMLILAVLFGILADYLLLHKENKDEEIKE